VTVDGRRLVPITPLPTRADAVWDALREAVPDVSTRPEALDAYTPALRQLHAMSLLTAEVNNGGFSQFFFNGGGMWVDDAIAGWAAAGLPAHEELTRQATDAVVAGMDGLVAAQRGKTLEAYAAWASESDLGRFDDRWWELADHEPNLDRFVAEHLDEIWAEPA